MKKSNYSKNNHCDCGKLIQNDSKYCNSCSQLKIWNSGIRKNREIIQCGCIDCGKSLSKNAQYNGAKRCQTCAAKERVLQLDNVFCSPKFLDSNPNWNGGISFKPYTVEFTKELKESIRKRDNFSCQNCGTEEKHYHRNLDIHHIDYDKTNCRVNNLITLCQKCNIKANFNRSYWEHHFNAIIMARQAKGLVLSGCSL